jgi:hypothetical protein
MKRHLISAGITFVTAFAIYFLTVIDSLTLESLLSGGLVSVLFVGVRAGIKALLEYFLVVTATK